MERKKAERPNQRLRTRKSLLQAANRLLQQGRKPSLEEIAAEALVSRATAYRYFPQLKALLLEASLDVAIPEADEILRGTAADNALERVLRVDTALHQMMLANESALRTMLAHSLERGTDEVTSESLPARQNRRTPLIAAALEPTRRQFKPAAFDALCKTLAMIIGTEGMVVCKDVLQLDDPETRKLKRWAIRALIDAARRSGASR